MRTEAKPTEPPIEIWQVADVAVLCIASAHGVDLIAPAEGIHVENDTGVGHRVGLEHAQRYFTCGGQKANFLTLHARNPTDAPLENDFQLSPWRAEAKAASMISTDTAASANEQATGAAVRTASRNSRVAAPSTGSAFTRLSIS